MGMFLSAGTSHVSSSQELTGLGLRLPPQPSHPFCGHLEEGVSPSAPGRGRALAQLALAAVGAAGEAGWLPGCAAALGRPSSHPRWPASPRIPGRHTLGSTAGEHQNGCQPCLTCLERAAFSSGLEVMLNQAISHEAHVCARTVYLHMLFGAGRSPIWF